MKRRQCSVPAVALIGGQWTCQRLAGHQGPHEVSYSKRSTMHYAWYDGDLLAAYRLLPGTVRWKRPLAYRLGGWTAFALFYGLPAALLFVGMSPLSAVVFCAVVAWLSIDRARFFDLGRFSVGVWRIPPTSPAPIIGLGWMLHGKDRTGPKAGLDFILGGRAVAVFTLMPRKEWAERKQYRAKWPAGGGPR
ncbi:hypothetical protein ACKI1S_16810 [Streptomyces galilaeus]|uniref:DUF2628 domain-containing protein n=1 Tax=Streptomyces galilaeus TaxID=33899 RepID=A0ABW9IH34_STRGJ